MNVFGKSFTYDGISSETYGLMLCTINSQQISKDSVMSWTINKGEINPHRHKPNYYNRKPSDVLKFDMTVIKRDGSNITAAERSEIIRWMTSPLSHVLLTIEDYEDDCHYHQDILYYCIVTNYSESVPTGDVTGMTFSFECDSPYGYTSIETTLFASDAMTTITLHNTSDEMYMDYYPTICLKGTGTGEVTITNENYPDEVMILQVKNGQELLIDCNLGDISDLNVGSFDYETDTNLVWLKLSYGENPITITGACEGEFRCQYIRKAGI